jgi:hypothetical protein
MKLEHPTELFYSHDEPTVLSRAISRPNKFRIHPGAKIPVRKFLVFPETEIKLQAPRHRRFPRDPNKALPQKTQP